MADEMKKLDRKIILISLSVVVVAILTAFLSSNLLESKNNLKQTKKAVDMQLALCNR